VRHEVAAAATAELWLVWALGEPSFDFQSVYEGGGGGAGGA